LNIRASIPCGTLVSLSVCCVTQRQLIDKETSIPQEIEATYIQ